MGVSQLAIRYLDKDNKLGLNWRSLSTFKCFISVNENIYNNKPEESTTGTIGDKKASLLRISITVSSVVSSNTTAGWNNLNSRPSFCR